MGVFLLVLIIIINIIVFAGYPLGKKLDEISNKNEEARRKQAALEGRKKFDNIDLSEKLNNINEAKIFYFTDKFYYYYKQEYLIIDKLKNCSNLKIEEELFREGHEKFCKYDYYSSSRHNMACFNSGYKSLVCNNGTIEQNELKEYFIDGFLKGLPFPLDLYYSFPNEYRVGLGEDYYQLLRKFDYRYKEAAAFINSLLGYSYLYV